MSRLTRAFVVGCGRSGTTLLQALLGSHPEIVTFPETKWFETNIGEIERRIYVRSLRTAERPVRFALARARSALGFAPPRAREQWKRISAWLEPGDEDAGLPFWGLRARPNLRHFVCAADAFALSQGASAWLEKTPNHVHYIAEITRLIPDARCIHIVRRGTDVVASMVDAARRYPGTHWESFHDPERAVERWNAALRATLAVADQPGHLVIRYEELVEEPAGVLARAFDFMGLPDHPDALSEYGDTLNQVTRDRESWKEATAGPISDRGDAKSRELFSAAERRRIRSMLLYHGEFPR